MKGLKLPRAEVIAKLEATRNDLIATWMAMHAVKDTYKNALELSKAAHEKTKKAQDVLAKELLKKLSTKKNAADIDVHLRASGTEVILCLKGDLLKKTQEADNKLNKARKAQTDKLMKEANDSLKGLMDAKLRGLHYECQTHTNVRIHYSPVKCIKHSLDSRIEVMWVYTTPEYLDENLKGMEKLLRAIKQDIDYLNNRIALIKTATNKSFTITNSNDLENVIFSP